MYSMSNVYIFAPIVLYVLDARGRGEQFFAVLARQEAKEAALELADSAEPMQAQPAWQKVKRQFNTRKELAADACRAEVH